MSVADYDSPGPRLRRLVSQPTTQELKTDVRRLLFAENHRWAMDGEHLSLQLKKDDLPAWDRATQTAPGYFKRVIVEVLRDSNIHVPSKEVQVEPTGKITLPAATNAEITDFLHRATPEQCGQTASSGVGGIV